MERSHRFIEFITIHNHYSVNYSIAAKVVGLKFHYSTIIIKSISQHFTDIVNANSSQGFRFSKPFIIVTFKVNCYFKFFSSVFEHLQLTPDDCDVEQAVNGKIRSSCAYLQQRKQFNILFLN